MASHQDKVAAYQAKVAEVKESMAAKRKQLPLRFHDPSKWTFKPKQEHPLYTTTSSQYGAAPPTVYNFPREFHGQTSKFTSKLDGAGPYRNFSLNV